MQSPPTRVSILTSRRPFPVLAAPAAGPLYSAWLEPE